MKHRGSGVGKRLIELKARSLAFPSSATNQAQPAGSSTKTFPVFKVPSVIALLTKVFYPCLMSTHYRPGTGRAASGHGS